MKNILIAAAALTLSGAAAPAFAQTFEGAVGIATIDTFGANLNAVQGMLSWRSASFLGAEAEAAFGVSDEEITPGVDVEMNFEFGAYATATLDIQNFAVFARVGYATVDAETSTGIDVGDDGLAWGVGGKVFFDGVNGMRFDYTKFDFDNDSDVYALAYVRRF